MIVEEGELAQKQERNQFAKFVEFEVERDERWAIYFCA